MSDQTGEGKEGFIQEHTEGTIVGNVDLLRLKLVGKDPEEVVDKETENTLWAIKQGERMFVENGLDISLKIVYNSASGQIGLPTSDAQFGEYSRVNTYLRETQEDGKTYKAILLRLPGGGPSVQKITKALTGLDLGEHDPDVPVVVPERISPEHQELMGIREAWGESKIVQNAKGDLIMLNTIRKFNERFGPPR